MQIHWRNVPLRAETRARIEERLQALAADRDDLIELHISAKTTRHHAHGGREVSVRSQWRGREIVASRSRPDLEQALAEAIDAFEQELRGLRERSSQHRDEHTTLPPERGVIDRVLVEQGFGFILTDGGERVYFHENALRPGLRLADLAEGQRVGLNFEAGEKGLQATVVIAAPDAPLA